MKKLFLLSLTILLFGLNAVMAQPGWNWPENKSDAQSNYTLFSDNVKFKDFKGAVGPFLYLYKNCPDLNKGLYSKAATMYEGLARAETKDVKRQIALWDSSMLMYELRTKYFPETEAENLNLQAYYSYYYQIVDQKRLPGLVELFAKTLEKVPNASLMPLNTSNYIDAVCKYKTVAPDKMTDDMIIALYEKIDAKFNERKAANDPNLKSWIEEKTKIDNIIVNCVKMDCDFVKKSLEPKYNENPSDLGLAKKIFTLMMGGKCTDDPLFTKVLKNIFSQEPNYGMAIRLAQEAKANKNYDEAIEYFEKAITLTDENGKKADCAMYIASIYASGKGSKVKAREYANKAIGFDGRKDAYEFIGDLYYGSSSDCSSSNPVLGRLIFIAAYEKYMIAGASSKMKNAEMQFPSRADAFTQGIKDGEKKSTGCWINETVTIRTRK